MKKINIKKDKSVAVKAKTSPFYTVDLVLAYKTYKAKGKDIMECLSKIIPAETIKSKGTFIVKSGELKSERVMKPFEIKKLLVSNLNKIIFHKRMLCFMK